MKALLGFICAIYAFELIFAKEIYILDESWVCNIKTTCLSCLRFPHCSWCALENTCFSKKHNAHEKFCKDNITDYEDFGLSFEGNAECACVGDEIKQQCYPGDVHEGPECSGRGKCQCGRCVCESNPDPNHPTKTVMGKFCEFDNFSCDGPKCKEGPYSLSQSKDDKNISTEKEEV